MCPLNNFVKARENTDRITASSLAVCERACVVFILTFNQFYLFFVLFFSLCFCVKFGFAETKIAQDSSVRVSNRCVFVCVRFLSSFIFS